MRRRRVGSQDGMKRHERRLLPFRFYEWRSQAIGTLARGRAQKRLSMTDKYVISRHGASISSVCELSYASHINAAASLGIEMVYTSDGESVKV
jgi:hypothetical protein